MTRLSGGSSMYCLYSASSNSCSSSPMSSGPCPAVLSSLFMALSLPQLSADHARWRALCRVLLAAAISAPASNRLGAARPLGGAVLSQLDQAVAHDLLELGLEAQDERQLLVRVLR